MNFEKWFEKARSPYDPEIRDKGLARESWEACKVEVLKIIKNNLTVNTTSNNAFLDQVIDIDIIKKIEKL